MQRPFSKCNVIACVNPKDNNSFYSTLIENFGCRFATCDKFNFNSKQNVLTMHNVFPGVNLPQYFKTKNNTEQKVIYYKTSLPKKIDTILSRVAKHLCLFYDNPDSRSFDILSPEHFLTRRFCFDNNQQLCSQICPLQQRSHFPATSLFISQHQTTICIPGNLNASNTQNVNNHKSIVHSCLETTQTNECYVRNTCNGIVVQWLDFNATAPTQK